MRIAVLDADRAQTDFICRTLSGAGHACRAFAEDGELVTQLSWQKFDLLVLDWNVVGIGDGEVMHWVRQRLSARLPVLFLTDRSYETGIGALLNSGTDDYLMTPVSETLLVARVDSLLRRAYHLQSPTLEQTFGVYKFDPKLRHASVSGRPVALTQKEFDLALLLFQHLSHPLSRSHISDVIWKQSNYVPSRTMDTHVSMLRSKLELRPENGYRLAPIYGYGYRLDRVDGDDE
jgi:DNA-binding response OmpR family regulator